MIGVSWPSGTDGGLDPPADGEDPPTSAVVAMDTGDGTSVLFNLSNAARMELALGTSLLIGEASSDLAGTASPRALAPRPRAPLPPRPAPRAILEKCWGDVVSVRSRSVQRWDTYLVPKGGVHNHFFVCFPPHRLLRPNYARVFDTMLLDGRS